MINNKSVCTIITINIGARRTKVLRMKDDGEINKRRI